MKKRGYHVYVKDGDGVWRPAMLNLLTGKFVACSQDNKYTPTRFVDWAHARKAIDPFLPKPPKTVTKARSKKAKLVMTGQAATLKLVAGVGLDHPDSRFQISEAA